jgi:hypothetical protein
MRPGSLAMPDPDHSSEADRLAWTLLTIAADQSVRVLEALAVCLVNGATQGQGEQVPARLPAAPVASELGRKLEVSGRIARRALRRSLADPTGGATAFHRIEATPDWSRDLPPVAIIGAFLFYKLPPAREASAAGESHRRGT